MENGEVDKAPDFFSFIPSFKPGECGHSYTNTSRGMFVLVINLRCGEDWEGMKLVFQHFLLELFQSWKPFWVAFIKSQETMKGLQLPKQH